MIIIVRNFHCADDVASFRYDIAEQYLRNAVIVVQRLYGEENNYYNIPDKWATLFNNLGHILRKQGKYEQALDCHNQVTNNWQLCY